MKTSIAFRRLWLPENRKIKKRSVFCLMLLSGCFLFSEVKSQNCNQCLIPSFPSVTVYQAFQTGHGMGFGLEAGNWKKDAGKFSYFIGTSMVWSQDSESKIKTSNSQNMTLLSFYVKGQYKLTKRLYAVVAPAIVNLSYFDVQTGLRYVLPVSRVIGVGIEPAYTFYQKQFLVNVNLHFALK
jgi:hypothetical protein